MDKKEMNMNAQREKLAGILREYRLEAETNSQEWKDKAQDSWDMVHGRIDWSYKSDDQSKVHMNRVGLAMEQMKAQIRQGLINFDQWLVVEDELGYHSELMSAGEARRLVYRGIMKTNPRAKITENIGIACVENRLATKLVPCVKERRAPGGKIIKELHIDHILLNLRNYYQDVYGGLYEYYEEEIDKHKLLELAAEKPTKQKPYRLDAVKNLQPGVRTEHDQEQRDKGNDIMPVRSGRRKPVLIQEFWCTVLDDDGMVMKWKTEDGKEIDLKNVIITMANGEVIIRDPEPFPTWDGESLFIKTTLIKAHDNPCGRSLLAPGVDMNRAEDELINAAIDAALKEAYNVNVLKVHGLADKSQASGGIKYGKTLLQNASLAPGEKLLDTVSTGQVPQGLLSVLGIIKAAGTENLRLNEVALSGNLPGKQVRSTELVQAQASIQGLFESICADIEDEYISKYAQKVFFLMLQYSDLLTDADLMYVFFGREDRVQAFKNTTARQRFDELANCFKFRGKGIRGVAHNSRQAQMLQNLFSMVAANPLISEAFERRGLDPVLLYEDILRGMQLDVEKYLNPEVAMYANLRQMIREEASLKAAQQEQGMLNGPMKQPPAQMEPGNGNAGM